MTLLSASDVEVIYGEGCGRCAELVQDGDETNRCPLCDSVVACAGLSLTLHQGEVVGIVGESGSGKSTLAETLALAHDADAGTVTLGNDDENLLAVAYEERIRRRTEDIGLVHQAVSDGLIQSVSGGGNVARPLLRTGWRRYEAVRSRVRELFEATETPVDRIDDPVETYSGGMQRRVQLAAGIATEPDVLVLDEPTTGLDVSVQAQILDLFRQLQRDQQIATIIVSHDLSVIRLLADRTLVMKNGQIIERGLTDRILEDPHEEYTQLLVNSTI